jgi:hypothetical protein
LLYFPAVLVLATNTEALRQVRGAAFKLIEAAGDLAEIASIQTSEKQVQRYAFPVRVFVPGDGTGIGP